MPVPPCPECRSGKHRNCHGDAWDLDLDVPTVCPCWASHDYNTPDDPDVDLQLADAAEDDEHNARMGEPRRGPK